LDGKSIEQSEEKRKKALYPRPETPRLYGPNGKFRREKGSGMDGGGRWLANFLEDNSGGRADDFSNFGRKLRAGGEIQTFNSIDNEAGRQLTRGASEFDRLSDAEGMRGRMGEPGRKFFGGRIKTVNGAGRRARLHGIDENDGTGSFPDFEQFGAIAGFLEHRHFSGDVFAQMAENSDADGVVTAERIAYGYKNRGGGGVHHRRSTQTFR
jgi:hypothetical protein